MTVMTASDNDLVPTQVDADLSLKCHPVGQDSSSTENIDTTCCNININCTCDSSGRKRSPLKRSIQVWAGELRVAGVGKVPRPVI